MKLNVLFLEKCPYGKALEIQYDILQKRQRGEIEDTLILTEHPPVITLGRCAERTHILASRQLLERNKINIFETNRGGDVTYHGFGQIVGYPIFNIKNFHKGIKKFVGNLEEIFIRLLKERYNINAKRSPKYTGVWVEDKKITAIGLAIKRRVTMHGFAFNVNTNLDNFNLIVPCGISDKGVTSLKDLIGRTVNFEEENKAVLKYFCRVFNYEGYTELCLDDYL